MEQHSTKPSLLSITGNFLPNSTETNVFHRDDDVHFLFHECNLVRTCRIDRTYVHLHAIQVKNNFRQS